MENWKHLKEHYSIFPKNLINHVFLLKHLPQQRESHFEVVEEVLLKYLVGVLKEIASSVTCLPKTSKTFDAWIELQTKQEKLNVGLKKIEIGESTCLYVRNQNCTILFTKLDTNYMRVITFRASLPNEYVTGTCGSFVVTYPETVDIIPISSLLLSECFSDQVDHLTDTCYEIAMPDTRKGGVNYTETREPSYPYLISDFLVTLLCPIQPDNVGKEMSKITEIKILKKLRDQINWSHCDSPFRRSGLWMSVKVVLHLSIQEEVESVSEAKLIYKVIILGCLVKLAKDYIINGGDCWDIISQIIVKLARRVKKLSSLPISSSSEIENQRKNTTKLVLQTIEEIHSNKPCQWKTNDLNTYQYIDRYIQTIENPKYGWHAQCVHEMENLTSYLSIERVNQLFPTAASDNLHLIDPVTMDYDIDSLLKEYSDGLFLNAEADVHINQTNIWIYRVERFVRNELDSLILNCSSDDYYKLLLAYTKTAFLTYSQADPMYFSRMTLVVLILVAFLDAIALEKYNLLKNYHCGIQVEMFQSLLVWKNCDLDCLGKLQKYFTKRLEKSTLGNWLEERSIASETDFQVQFANQSELMKLQKRQIERSTESKIQLKLSEIQTAEKEAKEIQNRLDHLQCNKEWSAVHLRTVHYFFQCPRCPVRSDWETKLTSVSRYQKPLPAVEILKDVVIFEYLIPSEIANLRDAVTILFEEILNRSIFSIDKKEIKTNWNEFLGTHGYAQSIGLQNRVVRLGSDAYDTLRTHYGRANPDVRYSTSNFILENALKCQYYSVNHLDVKYPDNPFSFNVSDTTQNDASTYQSLQFAFGQERVNENEVICSQYQCPQDLTLKEFITFGSLRCGHNIQLRNLYAAIASQILSLNKEPVLQLIMQTLWEIGLGQKEIHEDFENNAQFCIAFLELLDKYGNENANNWGNPIVMLCLSVIVIRILEVTKDDSIKEQAAEILRSYRNILDDWYCKLQTLVQKIPKGSKPNERKVMIELQLKAAICSAFTYNSSTDLNLGYNLKDSTDYTYWLKTISRLGNLVNRENVLTNCSISPFMRSLLRHARLAISLNLEYFIWSKRNSDIQFSKFKSALHCFVCSEWNPARTYSEGPNFKFAITLNKRHVYQACYNTETGTHNVCMDIIRGAFYVDGYPPSTLPETITRNPLFKSFFTNSDFRVQRDSNTFTTIDLYEGYHYEFTQNTQHLIIRQRLSSGSYAELLPKFLFEGHLPSDLINNYTQWYNSEKKQISFHKIYEPKHDYVMIPMESYNWRIQECVHTLEPDYSFLLSIKSEGHSKIAEVLRRIDKIEFINIFCVVINGNVKNFKIVSHLKRMNLQFTLNKTNGLLYCDNYPDFYNPISGRKWDEQDLGTFYGLNCGLVLQKETVEEPSGIKKIFLVQHGRVSISLSSSFTRHQCVTISPSNESLRNPPYFVYEVDQVLKRLKPGNNKSAWLYLALLHAATSNSLQDPFTQLTGTEMATWILQSGFVWSCSPYDTECLNTLEQIASLSPKHTYYPSHLKVMQNTKWPEGLENNSYAAYDGYIILTQKLLQESNRLRDLFPDGTTSNEQSKEIDFELDLSIRSYLRYNNMYNTAAHLNFNLCHSSSTISGLSRLPAFDYHRRQTDCLAKLAQLRYQICPGFSKATLKSFICTEEVVRTNLGTNFAETCLDSWFDINVRNTWLELYDLALQSSSSEQYHKMTLICGAILYSRVGSVDQMINFHNLSIIQKLLHNQLPKAPRPLIQERFYPENSEFDTSVMQNILQKYAAKAPSFEKCTTEQEMQKCEKEYKKALNQQIIRAIQKLELIWPAANINMEVLEWAFSGHNLLNASPKVLNEINYEGFTNWFSNRTFKLSVKSLDDILQTELRSSLHVSKVNFVTQPMQFLNIKMEFDKFDTCSIMFTCNNNEKSALEFAEVYSLFSSGKIELDTAGTSWIEQRENCLSCIGKYLSKLRQYVIPENPITCTLENVGIHYRLAPVVLLRNILKRSVGNLSHFVGALAVLWTNLKRLNRIILYESQKLKYAVELDRELEGENVRNWSPNENPEWLLLELELNITIRPIQVDVARRMLEMPGNTNGVLQLNMGEGKTSVIVPMVVSALTSENNRKLDNLLCRVTVLNSIFATNYNILSFALGGFLNKRIYTVPCRRDFAIQNCLSEIQEAYLECQKLGGVVITLPEHRLSFRLQMYNNFLQNEDGTKRDTFNDTGLKIYQIESWLRQHARDIVDESDEIFSVKYQLVYTAGKQLPLNGGSMRWKVGQKILEYICTNSHILREAILTSYLEFDPKICEKYPEQFSPLRITNDQCKNLFNEFVAKGVVNGGIFLLSGNLSDQDKQLVMDFLINENISHERHTEFLKMAGITKEQKSALLVISGYLKGGILFTALKKRWRVEYGVKKNSSGGRLIAVPFRAKDVAAERTEFGHPDMAIVLTLLSYYYSGLSDDQLKQCFHILKTRIRAPKGVYSLWLRKIPAEKITNPIKSYEGINLQDYEQRTYLFELLRKNKAVIDFWLDNVVFPKECKQFPGKLVTNAWDLCYERYKHPTTGFSGTDDTNVLLPAPISQQNLTVLENTNTNMEKVLEGPLNSYKRSLIMGATCEYVIGSIVKDDLRVLIDAGALMLQLGNEGIAKLWLDNDKNLKGVVYFNEKSEMVVKVRQHTGKDQLLTLSPFKDQLEDCAVYLDDQHTRGTDIKLPNNFKACVTVGTGVRRDKLIQACMRMRKLGRKQSVHFYISHDVDSKIKAQKKSQGHLSVNITVADILYWAKCNSENFVKDNMIYWAGNARNYAKNLVADDLFEESDKSVGEQNILGNRIQDADAQTLEKMYGVFHHRASLKYIILTWFLKIRNKLNGHQTLPISAMQTLTLLENITLKRIEKQVADETLYSFNSLLDEEQEKELEPERDEQLEQYRPHFEIPQKPNMHPNVRMLLHNGIFESTSQQPGISRLSEIFCQTTISSLIQYNSWGDLWYATNDFKNVLATGRYADSFLRPIRYFVSFTKLNLDKPANRLLVLSQFEVDQTIEYLRHRKASDNMPTLHMFTARWMEGQETFENNYNLQLPNSTNAKLTEEVMAPLLIAAGNLFFKSINEQRAFAIFLGFRFKPWSDEEKEGYKKGLITNTGFVLPQCSDLRAGCHFESDPSEMVQEIMKLRNEVLRETDHTMIIMNQCAFLNEKDKLEE